MGQKVCWKTLNSANKKRLGARHHLDSVVSAIWLNFFFVYSGLRGNMTEIARAREILRPK